MPRTINSQIPLKHGVIEDSLRSNIVSGVWAPGQRLPTQSELLAEFSTSKTTMQRAMDRLASDGFIETRGSLGTFVSPHPPHLTNYGLVFYHTPAEPRNWGGHLQSLVDATGKIEQTSPRKLPSFYDIQGHTDSEDYQRLRHAIRRQRMAGLIFSTNPDYLVGDPILEQPGIPRATVLMSKVTQFPTPVVTLDYVAFYDRAVDYLVDRGRKRIAILYYAGWGDNGKAEDDFLAATQRRGFSHEPYWCQHVNVFHPTGICRAVHLLMHAGQDERPDALIVTDDTMMESVINGLFAAGVKVPKDVEVVGHANFPVKATPVPVKRLGFDSRRILDACISLIDAQRRGEPVPQSTTLPAMFDDELT